MYRVCVNKLFTYTGEEQCPQGGIHNVQNVVFNKDAEDGEEEEHNEADKQNTPTGREVIFGLVLGGNKKITWNSIIKDIAGTGALCKMQ